MSQWAMTLTSMMQDFRFMSHLLLRSWVFDVLFLDGHQGHFLLHSFINAFMNFWSAACAFCSSCTQPCGSSHAALKAGVSSPCCATSEFRKSLCTCSCTLVASCISLSHGSSGFSSTLMFPFVSVVPPTLTS